MRNDENRLTTHFWSYFTTSKNRSNFICIKITAWEHISQNPHIWDFLHFPCDLSFQSCHSCPSIPFLEPQAVNSSLRWRLSRFARQPATLGLQACWGLRPKTPATQSAKLRFAFSFNVFQNIIHLNINYKYHFSIPIKRKRKRKKNLI